MRRVVRPNTRTTLPYRAPSLTDNDAASIWNFGNVLYRRPPHRTKTTDAVCAVRGCERDNTAVQTNNNKIHESITTKKKKFPQYHPIAPLSGGVASSAAIH